MSAPILRRLVVGLLVGCLVAGTAAIGGATAGSDPVEITFDAPETIEGNESVDLSATGVPDDVGVGSYEIVVSYDPDLLSLEVAETDRFAVEFDSDRGEDRVETTIVGYTGETSETPGDVTLADVTAAAADDGETELRIESVESVTDVDGNPLETTARNVTVDVQTDSGGGIVLPPPDSGDDGDDDTDLPDDGSDDDADKDGDDGDADDGSPDDDSVTPDDDGEETDDGDDGGDGLPLSPLVPLSAIALALVYGAYATRSAGRD